MFKIGASIIVLTAIAALVGPALSPFDPASQELALRLTGPTFTHPFGLDELGRDILTRVLAGARISFLVGLTVVAISATVGTLLGAMAGYFGGVFDDVVDIEVRALLGGTPFTPTFNVAPNNAFGDGVAANCEGFLTRFPYLQTPNQGNQPRPVDFPANQNFPQAAPVAPCS